MAQQKAGMDPTSSAGAADLVKGGGALIATVGDQIARLSLMKERDPAVIITKLNKLLDVYDLPTLRGLFYCMFRWKHVRGCPTYDLKGKAKDESIKKNCEKKCERTWIEGMSVRGAEDARNLWGCNLVGSGPTGDDGNYVTIEAIAVDYQTMTVSPIRSRVSKIQVWGGKVMTLFEDQLKLKVDAESSKAWRKAVEKMIPRNVWHQWILLAMEKAGLEEVRQLVAAGKDPKVSQAASKKKATWQEQAIAAWGLRGVTQQELETVLGKPSSEWTKEQEMGRLIGIKNAIDAGDETVSSVFGARTATVVDDEEAESPDKEITEEEAAESASAPAEQAKGGNGKTPDLW